MQAPRIGITTSYTDGTQKISHYYLHAIEKAGGIPLIVPMLETDSVTQAFADLLDGLVMTGGPGITRNLQGELPDDLEPVETVRDASDRTNLPCLYQSSNTWNMLRDAIHQCHARRRNLWGFTRRN